MEDDDSDNESITSLVSRSELELPLYDVNDSSDSEDEDEENVAVMLRFWIRNVFHRHNVNDHGNRDFPIVSRISLMIRKQIAHQLS